MSAYRNRWSLTFGDIKRVSKPKPPRLKGRFYTCVPCHNLKQLEQQHFVIKVCPWDPGKKHWLVVKRLI